MDNDYDMEDEMEKQIFNMKDIDKMTNYVDNQIESNIQVNNKPNKKKEDKIIPKKTQPQPQPQTQIQPPSKPKGNINQFESKLKSDIEYAINEVNDSDDEEENISEPIDYFTDKDIVIKRYSIIQKKLKEKNTQINLLRGQIENYKKKSNDIIDSIQNAKGTDIKDKKLIELVKKNQDIQLKVEKHKLKEQMLKKELTTAEGKLTQLQQELQSLTNSKEIPVDQAELLHLKKTVKKNENYLVEIRNKLQLAKEENIKLNVIIKREVGEAIDINRALTEKNYFRPRAEIIESLKAKIKQLENKIKVNDSIDANRINSGNTSVSNSSSTNAPIVSSNMIPYSEYKKEKEKLKAEIEKNKVELSQVVDKNNKLKLRTKVLEQDLKSQKDELTSKLKILIEKSDNDEKLIQAMKNELLKKGCNIGNYFEDTTFNLQQEINKLKSELKEKEKYINNINALLLPDNSVGQEINEDILNKETFSRVLVKLKELEKENKELKGNNSDSKISECLARDNAKLRLKLRELEDRLCNQASV